MQILYAVDAINPMIICCAKIEKYIWISHSLHMHSSTSTAIVLNVSYKAHLATGRSGIQMQDKINGRCNGIDAFHNFCSRTLIFRNHRLHRMERFSVNMYNC